MGGRASFAALIASVVAPSAALALAAFGAGCAPSPYADGEPDNDPVDSRDGPTGSKGGSTTSSGSPSTGGPPSSSGGTGTSGGTSSGGASGTSSGGTSGTSGTMPIPAGDQLIVDTFDGTSTFQAVTGTLTVVTNGTNPTGRICADASGLGHIEAKIGPVSPGTYTVTANVQQDTTAPGRTWTVEATSWGFGPDTRMKQGDLAEAVKQVASTVDVMSGAFAATFAVKLGATAGTCMLVDDIRVTKQ